MRVVITGGHGFLGRRVGSAVLADGVVDHAGGRRAVDDVVLVDVVDADGHADTRCRSVVTDLSVPGSFDELLDHDDDVSVFHLASMVSAECELDWSLAVSNNVNAVIELVEAAERRNRSTRVVFASSVAVYGGDAVSGPVGPSTKLLPETTYGMTKAIGELMINDATRRGVLDGRSARLPTVVVRPGRPNRAASGFFSGLFREPLAGQRCLVPVGDDVGVIIIGPASATAALVGLHDTLPEQLGADRAVPLPGLTVTVGEMVEVLRDVGGQECVDLLDREVDPEIDAIVRGWATVWDDEAGRDLGLPADATLHDIVREHVETA